MSAAYISVHNQNKKIPEDLIDFRLRFPIFVHFSFIHEKFSNAVTIGCFRDSFYFTCRYSDVESIREGSVKTWIQLILVQKNFSTCHPAHHFQSFFFAFSQTGKFTNLYRFARLIHGKQLKLRNRLNGI